MCTGRGAGRRSCIDTRSVLPIRCYTFGLGLFSLSLPNRLSLLPFDSSETFLLLPKFAQPSLLLPQLVKFLLLPLVKKYDGRRGGSGVGCVGRRSPHRRCYDRGLEVVGMIPDSHRVLMMKMMLILWRRKQAGAATCAGVECTRSTEAGQTGTAQG